MSAAGAAPDMGNLLLTDSFRPFALLQHDTAARAGLRPLNGSDTFHVVFPCFFWDFVLKQPSFGSALIRINISFVY